MNRKLMLLLMGGLLLLSGCAVIDFLDGKHFDHSGEYSRPQESRGYTGGSSSGGGHSH